MKMMKVLPSVILASLLMTGCTLMKGESYNVKKYKNEVTCAEFYEAFNKGSTETAKIPAMIPPEGFDVSVKGSTKFTISTVSKLEGKEFKKQVMADTEQISAEYDADNRMGHSKVDGTMTVEYKIQYGEMEETASQKIKGEFYGKETKNSETEYTIEIASVLEEKANSYTNTSSTFATNFIGRASSRIGFNTIPVIPPASYEAMTEEQKSQYKFYNDNGVLTVTRTYDGEEGDNIVATGKFEDVMVAQISFAENKVSYVIKDDAKEETTYLQDYDEFVAGEVITEKSSGYYKATINTSAVALEFEYSNYGQGYYSISSMFPSTGF